MGIYDAAFIYCLFSNISQNKWNFIWFIVACADECMSMPFGRKMVTCNYQEACDKSRIFVGIRLFWNQNRKKKLMPCNPVMHWRILVQIVLHYQEILDTPALFMASFKAAIYTNIYIYQNGQLASSQIAQPGCGSLKELKDASSGLKWPATWDTVTYVIGVSKKCLMMSYASL